MATANLGRVGFVNKGTYSGATAYKVNDVVTYNTGTYACIQANTGQAPTNTSYWQNWVADNAVHKTGNETIAGVKTFSSSPIVPTPTTDFQVATKKYVDDNMGPTWSANDTRVKTALNASGTAPIYACRAWVNFNGTGTVAIRASGNVSSITDNGVGIYAVNFTTAMQDANYSISSNHTGESSASGESIGSYTTTGVLLYTGNNSASYDPSSVFLAVFR